MIIALCVNNICLLSLDGCFYLSFITTKKKHKIDNRRGVGLSNCRLYARLSNNSDISFRQSMLLEHFTLPKRNGSTRI